MRDVYTCADLRRWPSLVEEGNESIRLGVLGDPVAHSLSPQMQNAALQACGLKMQYARFHIRATELEEALQMLPALGFVGVNLTIPHKIAAVGMVDELDDFARKVGAINTVRVHGKKLTGFNTDGPGFSRAIRDEFGVHLRELRVLLLGAGGGAGRAIALQCAAEGCERLVLVNRTLTRTEVLAAELRELSRGMRVMAVPWEERALRVHLADMDLIVNATPLGMKQGDESVIAPSLLHSGLMVYDTVYTPAGTPLLTNAIKAGVRHANGHSMLLHQGALAFAHWFERDAPAATMRAALSRGN